MANLITVFFFVFVVGLIAWTCTTYIVKQDSKEFIKEELRNLFDISKMLFVSLKSLIGGLIKYWRSPESIEETSSELKGLEVVDAVETMGVIPSVEAVEEDTALSQFSSELVEVITEEEEKVA